MGEFVTAIGLLGPALFLYAYAMISLGRWQPSMLRYHLLNLLGALCLLTSLLVQWNIAVCFMECSWAAISLYGMVRALRCSSQ